MADPLRIGEAARRSGFTVSETGDTHEYQSYKITGWPPQSYVRRSAGLWSAERRAGLTQ